MNRGFDGALLGAVAGFAATLPMTMAMARLHERLPHHERYPLPPRELAEDLPDMAEHRSVSTLVYHFLYGAAAGALLGATRARRDLPTGATYGIMVWLASYLGWIPAFRRLTPATRHPRRRNGLMLASHLVWGAALALGLRELERSQHHGFGRSASPDPSLKDRSEPTI